MRLLRIELDNIKSYLSETIVFGDGVNVIYGRNGSGKTTLLEAVGLALFNYLPYSQADFVRRGEKKGKITVVFESSLDNQVYRIEREIGSGSGCYVYSDLATPIAEGVGETFSFLREHMGVPDTVSLDDLFENAVGVPQGSLKAAFLLSATNRRRVFNPLLQLDEYETAWNQLRTLNNYCEGEVSSLSSRLEVVQKETLPFLQKEKEETGSRIKEAENDLSDLTTLLRNLTNERQRWRDAHEEVERAENEYAAALRNCESATLEQNRAYELLRAAKGAAQIVERTQPGYEEYERVLTEFARLEDDRKKRDGLLAKMASTRELLVASQLSVKNFRDRLEEVEQARVEMKRLAPLLTEREQAESHFEKAAEDLRELQRAEERGREAKGRLDDLIVRLNRITSEANERQKLLETLHQVEQSLSLLRNSVAEKLANLTGLKQEREALVHRIDELEATEGVECPVCQEPMSAEKAQELVASYRNKKEQLESTIRSIENELLSDRNSEELLAAKREETQKVIDGLATPAAVRQLQTEVAEQRAIVTEWNNKCTAFHDVHNRLETCQQTLREMGDPRSDYNRFDLIIKNGGDVAKKLAEAGVRLAKVQADVDDLEGELQQFDGLSEALEQLRSIEQRFAVDHADYLSNKKAADELPVRTRAAKEADDKLEAAQKQHAQAEAVVIMARTNYDAERHEQVEVEWMNTNSDFAVVSSRLDDARNRMEQLKGRLKQAEQEVTTLEGQLTAAQETKRAAVFVREGIRDAGPMIALIMTGRISREADRIFASIVGDRSMHLTWKNDYSIVAEQDGYVREFQNLSGGEQTAAALAVRLALLRQMSNIDIAFFDEPTADLDDGRRSTLVNQLTSIEGFRQLFVISHDDAFETAAQHVIHIEKQNGISREVKTMVESVGL